MFEKEAEERAEEEAETIDDCDYDGCSRSCARDYYYFGFKDGAEFGYNKAMKEWRDCFMSCSSPYCADKFRDIQCNGMLGNMTKEASDGSNREKGV